MGSIGGAVFYFFKGLFNSPKKERFFGGIQHLKRRAPVLGGNFGLWAGLFSCFDCAFMYARNKEDIYNPIASGFLTGGVLAIRAGTRVALRNAIFGGVILAMIELVSSIMMKMQKKSELEFQNAKIQEEVQKEKARRSREMNKYKDEIEKRKGSQFGKAAVQI